MAFQILIIEDDEVWGNKFRDLLNEMSLTVDVFDCKDSEAARKFLQTNEVQLILLDLCLEGDMFTEKSKDFFRWVVMNYPHIPKLITSGWHISTDDMFDLGKLSQEGLLDFISKGSFSLSDFRSKVKKLLKKFLVIRMLHLSDLHLGTEVEAEQYYVQLETDLLFNLDVNQIDFLVISGDVANRSTQAEYAAALMFVQMMQNRFGIKTSNLIIVPGNHDLNWKIARDAYRYINRESLVTSVKEGSAIPAGDAGILMRNELRYKKRFSNFSKYFYQQLFNQPYPSEYAQQGLITESVENRILFLALNSSWQIDHHFKDRAGINMSALTKALDQLIDTEYKTWMKIAVWHHPVSGRQMMNDDFMQLLSVHGFQISLSGHLHEAIDGFYKYDHNRGLHIIGAGTFGAPADQQEAGIPLQYNLLTLDKEAGTALVKTRRKERPDGAWMADARWGDKNHPEPYYPFPINWQ